MPYIGNSPANVGNYQSLDDMVKSVIELNSDIDDVEKSIFDGNYPTNISTEYLENLEKIRG